HPAAGDGGPAKPFRKPDRAVECADGRCSAGGPAHPVGVHLSGKVFYPGAARRLPEGMSRCLCLMGSHRRWRGCGPVLLFTKPFKTPFIRGNGEPASLPCRCERSNRSNTLPKGIFPLLFSRNF